MTEMHNLSSDIERAVDEIFDMNRRAKQPQISFKKQNDDDINPTRQNSIQSINIPSDTLLVLGLLLILSSENDDKLLLLALLYILS